MKIGRFSLPAIKSKPLKLVNWTYTLLVVTCAATSGTFATADESLPDINAKVYSARIERRSTSGRVYLMSVPNPGQQLPADGRIVLLKQGGVPVMAFRVLKEYPDKTEFAGKWLRRYGDTQQLTPGTQYEAFEKVSDREPPALTHQDQKDLKEVEVPAPAASPIVAEAAPPVAPPLPVEPTPALPPTAPITPEAAAPVPPAPMPPAPLPSPTAEVAAPLPVESPAPPVVEASPVVETPPLPEPAVAEAPIPAQSPADLSGPGQIPAPAVKDGTSDDLPAPTVEPEPKTKSFDPELDATTSPQPMASPDINGDDLSGLVVEEIKQFDQQMNALSVGVGLYRNILNNDNGNVGGAVASSASFYNSAGTIRYSRTLTHLLHFKTKTLQDNLCIDAALGFYKYLGVTTNGDTYTVVPASVELRYTLLPSESFGFFFYGGVIRSFVAQSINPDPNIIAGLNSVLPDAGVGMLFQIGPSWYMRADAGWDYFGLSIALRF